MTLWERVAGTYLDKDGTIAVPEVVATLGALVGVACPVWDFAVRGHDFPVAAFCTSIGALVFGLGAAQRIRDGLWKPDDDREHQE